MTYSELCDIIRELDKKDQDSNRVKEIKFSNKEGGNLFKKEREHKKTQEIW